MATETEPTQRATYPNPFDERPAWEVFNEEEEKRRQEQASEAAEARKRPAPANEDGSGLTQAEKDAIAADYYAQAAVEQPAPAQPEKGLPKCSVKPGTIAKVTAEGLELMTHRNNEWRQGLGNFKAKNPDGSRGLNPTAKWLGAVLSDIGGPNSDGIYPSQAEMRERSGMTADQIKDGLADLKRSRLILKTGERGTNHVVEWQLVRPTQWGR